MTGHRGLQCRAGYRSRTIRHDQFPRHRLSEKGDDDHALADYDSAEDAPNFAGAFNNRGMIYMRKGDLKRARRIQRRSQNQAEMLSRVPNRGRVLTLTSNMTPRWRILPKPKIESGATRSRSDRCVTYTEMASSTGAGGLQWRDPKFPKCPTRWPAAAMLSGQGRSRCRAEGLQRRAGHQSEQYSRPYRPRAILRERRDLARPALTIGPPPRR